MAENKMHILVCGGTGCHASKSEEIVKNLVDLLLENKLENEVKVLATEIGRASCRERV